MRRSLSIVTLVVALAALAVALRAGPLDPPAGPIAPTYRTLQEVEPRTPINSANTPGDAGNLFIISQPGTYVLTGDVTAAPGFTGTGIRVAASHVSIDLRGFFLTGVTGSSNGIFIASGSLTDVSVMNGEIRSWGTNGIGGPSPTLPKRVTVRHVNATGCGNYGMQLGGESLVENCVASSNSFGGIVATGVVSGCLANLNGSVGGIYLGATSTALNCSVQNNTGGGITAGKCSTLTNCAAQGTVNGPGFWCDFGCTVQNCSAYGSTGTIGDGFNAQDGTTLTGCSAFGCARDGFIVANSCTVSRCTGSGNARNQFLGSDSNVFLENTAGHSNGLSSGAGFSMTGLRNRVEGNTATMQASGYTAPNTLNIFVRNSAGSCTNNYGNVVAGNLIAPIVTSSAMVGSAGNALVNYAN